MCHTKDRHSSSLMCQVVLAAGEQTWRESIDPGTVQENYRCRGAAGLMVDLDGGDSAGELETVAYHVML